MSARDVIVRSSDSGGFRQDIVAGPHHLNADEPQSLGGSDTAPAPYELLMAALGACTSMTLRMYAGRKQWPMEGVEVYLHHEKTVGSDGSQIDKFRRGIVFNGAQLTQEQRERLLEIASKCPVHKTLEGGGNIIETFERRSADGQ